MSQQLIEVLRQQRNEALDRGAQMAAGLILAQVRIKELEAALAKIDEDRKKEAQET